MSAEKFKALVHFIVHECRDNPGRLGAVRLNKALWLTDMYAYQEIGVPVTGERYLKRKMGPVPASILATLRELQSESKIMIRERKHRYDAREYISLVDPDPSLLSDYDRDVVKAVLGFVCDLTANEISDFTHEEVWSAAKEGEEMPLYATLATGRGEITDDVKMWADSIVQEVDGEKASA